MCTCHHVINNLSSCCVFDHYYRNFIKLQVFTRVVPVIDLEAVKFAFSLFLYFSQFPSQKQKNKRFFI